MTGKRQVAGLTRRPDLLKKRKHSRFTSAWLPRTAALIIAVAVGIAIVSSTGANTPQPTEEIVFRSERAGQPDLYVIGRDGLNFRRLTFTEARERTPRISPDGKWVAFSSNAAGNFDIWVVRRDGSALTQVSSNPEFEDNPVWLPDGRLVFLRGPFSCEAACATAVVVKRGGGQEATIPIGGIQSGTLDVTPDGTRILFGRNGALYSAKLDGTAEAEVTSPPAGAFDFRPSYSPEGTRIVFLRSPDGVNNELYVANSNGGGDTQLTSTPGRHEEYPGWSAAGDKILFVTFGNEDPRLRTIDPDGTGEALVSTDIKAPFLDTFSRDGRDTSVWHEILFGGGSAVEQTNGRVEVSFAADATQGGPFDNIEAHFGSHCSLPGDFDMQVDYDALAWPSANGTQATLDAFFANASVGRESQVSAEQYLAWLDGRGGWATTEENSGALRLVRSSGQLRGYWRYQDVWVPLRSNAANTNSVVFGFSLRSFNNQFAHQPIKVAFDNFRLNSGVVECPDWWRNAAFGDFG